MAEGIDYKKQVEDAQMVRLWDVFFIAPVLIIISFLPNIPWWSRITLFGIGTGTLIYNGYFYLKYRNQN